MSTSEIRNILAECCSDMEFKRNGKDSGVLISVENSVPTFEAFCGSVVKFFHSVDELINDPFFDGKSISELNDAGDTEFRFC